MGRVAGSAALDRLRIILSLVRRDYAVQYAGTALGFTWVLVQYLFQILLFFLIFGVLLRQAMPGRLDAVSGGAGDYLSYLLGGMCLWLPLSEMFLRACGILSENRALVRRTAVGLGGFLWVPVVQALFHYALIVVPVLLVGVVRGSAGPSSPLAVLLGFGLIFCLSGWSIILARVSVLLRDLSPLLRLLLQILFWMTPIVYVAPDWMIPYFNWNPLFGLVALHRDLLFPAALSLEVDSGALAGVAWFAGFSLIAYALSARRLNALVVDHL